MNDVCWYWSKLCKVKEEFKWGSDEQHKWHWKGDLMGAYKVKLGYELYLNLQSRKPLWTKIIWTRLATPRHSFTAWLLMQPKLLVNTGIARYSKGIPIGCDLCNKEEETQEYLFFKCTYTQQVWQNTTSWMKIQCTSTSLQEWCEYLLQLIMPRVHKEIIYSMFTATIYHIWRTRHELKYQVIPKGWKTTAHSIKGHTRQRVLFLAQHTKSYRKYKDIVMNR
ncbi:hypothetical protein Cgig2_011569 [Carnegiea gigantea]|uniref:Reverse transcriptase zinc-binding domain-containing protein n=1 Tax=Carnegiea gigantea TaxID=171969 RepID=A0A9Q1GJ50_9CARY|nr:hypothetical protein Cgig2_011569 [Carnegiea gigantea]